MNKNKRLATFSMILFSIVSLSACVASNPSKNTASNPSTLSMQKNTAQHGLKVISSKSATLSKVKLTQERWGHKVSGSVILKTMQRNVLKLPGYITVTVKASDGSKIEQIKANYHRKFGASKIGHFDAKLMQKIPNSALVIIEHHQ